MAKPPMNSNSTKKGLSPDKKMKKKQSILSAEKVDWVDYKDVNLLRRFMSERAKIRARRVTGNDQQQQAAVAKAIKLSREMALLPYSVRQVQQRSKGKGRGDRGERRDSELSAEAIGLAPAPGHQDGGHQESGRQDGGAEQYKGYDENVEDTFEGADDTVTATDEESN